MYMYIYLHVFYIIDFFLNIRVILYLIFEYIRDLVYFLEIMTYVYLTVGLVQ